MQGSTLFSEGFSQYASRMTSKSITNDPMKMRQFLKYDHDRYLRGRSGERLKELPLYKVENQAYIHYGKGSVVLYALQDYIGEDKVNLAMKNFLEEYRYKKPPYPTSLDFLRHLEPQVPDSLQYLITDWFKEITLYDNRMKEANYKKLDNGKYEVTLERLYSQKRMKFNKENSSITIQLDSLPVKAAIDPRHLLIDRVYSDNIKNISLEE